MIIKENFEIKNLTTYKIGGIVKKVFFPETQSEFSELLREQPDAIVLGSCSNILFSSNGFDGEVILTTELKQFEIRGTHVFASAGVKGPLLSQKTAEAKKDELDFSYRHSLLKSGRYILLHAEFDLKKGTPEEIKSLIDRNMEFRKNIQPSLAHPNAGSVFKNPEHDSAGRLLDKAGVKSFDLPRAKVWENHANFIVNKGDATSEDILTLMVMMYNAVKKQYTIELKPEIIFLGDKTEREVSLRSGKNVLAALHRLGYKNAELVDVSPNIMNDLKGFEYAYNTMHGKYGEDGCIQGILEILKIPYTGCGVMSSAICMNKEYTKRVLSTCKDIPLIKSVFVRKGEEVNKKVTEAGWYD